MVNPEELLADLAVLARSQGQRTDLLQTAADRLRGFGGYRWVGLYDADRRAGVVRNLVWSGPGAPSYPEFPITCGLTAKAIASAKTVNAGDVLADPGYLTALGSTRSEIIVPVLDAAARVAGTIDVESEEPHAFGADAQAFLESCSAALRPLWLL